MDILQQLNREIDATLKECDASLTPKVCELRSTTEGYRHLKSLIAQRVRGGATIAEAIVAIEKEFGNTLSED